MAESDFNRDAPATKGDIAELHAALRADIDKLSIKVDAYWHASDRSFRAAQWMAGLALALILAATTAIVLPTVAPYLPKPAPAIVTGK